MPQITDPEVEVLATFAGTLHDDYAEANAAWRGSPFAWILNQQSRSKGAIGEKLVAGYFALKGFNVTRSPDSDADRVIEEKRVEIKFSTLWNTGQYKFQQLRDQNYEIAVCLGISPFDAHCWVIEKSEIMRRWKARDGIQPQHGGSEGSDTAWMSITPTDIPTWLQERGGRLRKAVEILSSLTGYVPHL